MKHEVIDKLDVVERQLNEAIRLFFEGRDSVVIHTIVASAHQILFDVGKKSEIESSIKNLSALSKSETKDFLSQVNYPYNFFKHADKDQNSKLDIGPLSHMTQDFIMDAVVMLQRIKGDIPNNAKVFWFWFVSQYPDEFFNLPFDGAIAEMQQQGLSDWSFNEISEFLKFTEAMGHEDT